MKPSDIKTLNDFLKIDPNQIQSFMNEFYEHIQSTRPPVSYVPSSANGKYKISGIKTFYAIPPDKLKECLEDITPTLQQLAHARKTATDLGIPDADILIEFKKATWIDDNIRTATMKVNVSAPDAKMEAKVEFVHQTGPA